MWKFVKKIFDNDIVAAVSVIILNTLPLTMIASIVITPDTPVFLFFSFAVYFTWYLVKTDNVKYWYITGLFFGMALLSKYTGILFALNLFIYAIIDGKLKWFKNKHFYFMFLISLIIFIPVIIWNYRHEWVSFIFQFNHGLSNTKFHFWYIFEYLGSQCLVVGPFIFISGIFGAISYFKSRDSKKLFLASFSIPIIAFFIFTAPKQLPGANWPAFAYFPFSIIVAEYLCEKTSKLKKTILVLGIAFNIITSLVLGLHVKYMIIPIHKFSKKAAIKDVTNYFTGWKTLADDLLKRDIRYVISDSHQLGGIISYYTKGKFGVFLNNKRQNQFAYWNIPDNLAILKTAIVRRISYDSHKKGRIVYIKRNGLLIRKYEIIETNGYKL
jgi:4-amino-4-deoxy-L-arabinose transferase-like glycosyltransferase